MSAASAVSATSTTSASSRKTARTTKLRFSEVAPTQAYASKGDDLLNHDPRFWHSPFTVCNFFVWELSDGNFLSGFVKYLIALGWKFWLLIKLTVGWWDQELLHVMQIRQRAETFDVDDFDEDNKQEATMNAVGESHSLVWQLVPSAVVVAKFGEAANESPLLVFDEKIECYSSYSLRLILWIAYLCQYAAVVLVCVSENIVTGFGVWLFFAFIVAIGNVVKYTVDPKYQRGVENWVSSKCRCLLWCCCCGVLRPKPNKQEPDQEVEGQVVEMETRAPWSQAEADAYAEADAARRPTATFDEEVEVDAAEVEVLPASTTTQRRIDINPVSGTSSVSSTSASTGPRIDITPPSQRAMGDSIDGEVTNVMFAQAFEELAAAAAEEEGTVGEIVGQVLDLDAQGEVLQVLGPSGGFAAPQQAPRTRPTTASDEAEAKAEVPGDVVEVQFESSLQLDQEHTVTVGGASITVSASDAQIVSDLSGLGSQQPRHGFL